MTIKYFLAIDIGGTKVVSFIFCGETLEILEEKKFKTEQNMLEQLGIIINYYKKSYELFAIGISSAGQIDPNEGKVLSVSPNVKNWQGHNVVKYVEKKFNIPCFIENDVNCAAVAEGYERLKNRSFVFISIGTGLGGAIVNNGKVLESKNHFLGEIGHMILYPEGVVCNCGKKGCLERYVSGKALLKQIKKEIENKKEDHMAIQECLGDISSEIRQQFIFNLGTALMTIQNILDPEEIVLGGGILETASLWWEDLSNYILNNSNITITLSRSIYGNKASCIGAYLNAREKLILKEN